MREITYLFALLSLMGLVGIYHKRPWGPATAAFASALWSAYALSRVEYAWALVEFVYAWGAGMTFLKWFMEGECSTRKRP